VARKANKRYGWLWSAGLFFAVGYLVTALGIRPAGPAVDSPGASSAPTAPGTLPGIAAEAPPEVPRSPVYAIAALVALTIPFTARTTGLLRGALRGLGYGLAGAAGICLGVGGLAWRIGPEATKVSAALAGLTTLICCGATGAIFALLAERRHRRLYGQEG
jgi:hypothetical protein